MSRARDHLSLWVACLAQLIVVVDVSVTNVALPTIHRDLGLGESSASWIATSYSLGFAGALLVGARLADVFGTLRLLVWSVGAFTIASLLGGLAMEGWTLVATRAAQGVAAAAVTPATFTLLTLTFREGPLRVRSVATWTAVSLAGGGLGNVASGLLTELISWRATLLINIPIGILIILAVCALRRRDTDARGGSTRIDLVGAILAVAAFTSATYALAVFGAQPIGGAPIVAGTAAIALFVALAIQQRRAPHPLIPTSLTRDRRIVLSTVSTLLTGACFQVSLWFFLTYRMQTQFDYSPLQAGLAFLPLTATTLAVNMWLTPRLMARLTPRSLVAAGAMVAAGGLIWLTVVDHGPFAVALLAPTLVVGFGGGLMNTPLAMLVTMGVRPQHAGAASGLMNTAKQFGGAIGVAGAGAVATGTGGDGAAFGLMVIALLGAAVTVAGVRVEDQ